MQSGTVEYFKQQKEALLAAFPPPLFKPDEFAAAASKGDENAATLLSMRETMCEKQSSIAAHCFHTTGVMTFDDSWGAETGRGGVAQWFSK